MGFYDWLVLTVFAFFAMMVFAEGLLKAGRR
jgi:hypothetical protein